MYGQRTVVPGRTARPSAPPYVQTVQPARASRSPAARRQGRRAAQTSGQRSGARGPRPRGLQPRGARGHTFWTGTALLGGTILQQLQQLTLNRCQSFVTGTELALSTGGSCRKRKFSKAKISILR